LDYGRIRQAILGSYEKDRSDGDGIKKPPRLRGGVKPMFGRLVAFTAQSAFEEVFEEFYELDGPFHIQFREVHIEALLRGIRYDSHLNQHKLRVNASPHLHDVPHTINIISEPVSDEELRLITEETVSNGIEVR